MKKRKIEWTKVGDGWMGVGNDFEAWVGHSHGTRQWTFNYTRIYAKSGASIGGGGIFSNDEDAKAAVDRLYR